MAEQLLGVHLSYLQCWCALYSRPPPPEFPAVVCGSPRYQLPWGAAAGCEGWDLRISRYGPRLLLHHRPSSSFSPTGAVDQFALFPFKHTAPSLPHSLITRSARIRTSFGGLETLSKGSKCQTTPGSGSPLPAAVLRAPRRAKYKSPLSERRSFHALTVAPTACSLLLTRRTTPRLQIKQHNSPRAQQSHGNKCNSFAEAKRW